MSIQKIPTRPGMGRSLIDHNPGNRNFPARGVLFAAQAPLRDRTWRRVGAYDQGLTSQCVAYSGKGMFNTLPFSKAHPYLKRKLISTKKWYDGAQDNDEWPGKEPDYEGTSARGLLRYLLSTGEIKEYRWAFGIDDVLQTVSHWGPVSIGSNWSYSMFDPDPETGLVKYEGQMAGGHQWQMIGLDVKNEEAICMNSWGKRWGQNGRFRMKFDTLDALLKDDGDAYTVVTVK